MLEIITPIICEILIVLAGILGIVIYIQAIA